MNDPLIYACLVCNGCDLTYMALALLEELTTHTCPLCGRTDNRIVRSEIDQVAEV